MWAEQASVATSLAATFGPGGRKLSKNKGVAKSKIPIGILFILQFGCHQASTSDPYDFSKTTWQKVQVASNFERYQSEADTSLSKEVYYFPAGKKHIEYFTIAGKKYGKETRWYENGQVELEAYFINDKKEGQVIGYFENGSINNIHEYKNDRKNGRAVYYFPNGKIKLDGFYVDDQLSGIGKFYNENGELVKTQNY